MKTSRNYWLDLVMALVATVLLVSSVLLWVVLPQGYFRSRLVWLDIHKWSGLALTLAVVVHVALHRRWLWTMTKRTFARNSPGAARSDSDAYELRD